MASLQYAVVLFVCNVVFASASISQSVLRILPEKGEDRISGHRKIPKKDRLYCESWRFTVETNDCQKWQSVPKRCLEFVTEYMTGHRYRSDSEAVADLALAYAKSVEVTRVGKDAWIFDIDETLLSNVPAHTICGFGSETFDGNCFDERHDLCAAPALPASMRLYRGLEQLDFKIILLTGRNESQRHCTEKNLQYAGFSNWERLILRGDSDKGKPAIIYKSEKRMKLQEEGYRILGNSGDQWSDLMGFAVAKRSFKLPNLMYYIS